MVGNISSEWREFIGFPSRDRIRIFAVFSSGKVMAKLKTSPVFSRSCPK
jgi:hypothetical protein